MPRLKQLALPLVALLLVVSTAIIAIGALIDFRTRSSGPEAVARRYFAALQAADSDLALDTIDPASREHDRAFVENLAGNTYRVSGVAVRSASLLERLAGAAPGPRDVTIFLEVDEAVSGDVWQATPRVGLVEEQGHWYLARAPLAQAGPGAGGGSSSGSLPDLPAARGLTPVLPSPRSLA